MKVLSILIAMLTSLFLSSPASAGDEGAFNKMKKMAEQGDAESQVYLGNMYYNGKEVELDNKKAVFWYQKAAAQENAKGIGNLANMYSSGEGVKQNDKKASELYIKAAKKGNIESQLNLGNQYYSGRGVVKNLQRAVYWYKEAAMKGSEGAQHNLGVMYVEGNGVPENYFKSYGWFSQLEDSVKYGKKAVRLKRELMRTFRGSEALDAADEANNIRACISQSRFCKREKL